MQSKSRFLGHFCWAGEIWRVGVVHLVVFLVVLACVLRATTKIGKRRSTFFFGGGSAICSCQSNDEITKSPFFPKQGVGWRSSNSPWPLTLQALCTLTDEFDFELPKPAGCKVIIWRCKSIVNKNVLATFRIYLLCRSGTLFCAVSHMTAFTGDRSTGRVLCGASGQNDRIGHIG